MHPIHKSGSSVVNPQLVLLYLYKFTLDSVITVVADFLCSCTLIHLLLQTIHVLFQTLNGTSTGQHSG